MALRPLRKSSNQLILQVSKNALSDLHSGQRFYCAIFPTIKVVNTHFTAQHVYITSGKYYRITPEYVVNDQVYSRRVFKVFNDLKHGLILTFELPNLFNNHSSTENILFYFLSCWTFSFGG